MNILSHLSYVILTHVKISVIATLRIRLLEGGVEMHRRKQ